MGIGKPVGQEVTYDIRTIHSAVFKGAKGYIRDREIVLQDLRHFVDWYNKTMKGMK